MILDDLFINVYSMQVFDLFTGGSLNRYISVILITQILYYQGRYCRHNSPKAHYLFALENIRDNKQFMYSTQQVYPEDSLRLCNAYLNATNRIR